MKTIFIVLNLYILISLIKSLKRTNWDRFCTTLKREKVTNDDSKFTAKRIRLIEKADKITNDYAKTLEEIKKVDSNSDKFYELAGKLELLDEKRNLVYQQMEEIGMEV